MSDISFFTKRKDEVQFARKKKLEKSQILASPWGHSKKLLFYFFTRTVLKTKKCYFTAFEMLRGVL